MELNKIYRKNQRYINPVSVYYEITKNEMPLEFEKFSPSKLSFIPKCKKHSHIHLYNL